MTDEQIAAMTLPELVALNGALMLGVAAAERGEKAGIAYDAALSADGEAVSVVLTVPVVRDEPEAVCAGGGAA